MKHLTIEEIREHMLKNIKGVARSIVGWGFAVIALAFYFYGDPSGIRYEPGFFSIIGMGIILMVMGVLVYFKVTATEKMVNTMSGEEIKEMLMKKKEKSYSS